MPSCFLIPEWCALAYELPHVPRLRNLAVLMAPDSLRRLAPPNLELQRTAGPELFRYVPKHRAIITWPFLSQPGRYFGKVFNPSAAAGCAKNFARAARSAGRGELDFTVPQPIHFHPELDTLLMSEVSGKNVSGLLLGQDGELPQRVGSALASLHDSTIEPRAHLNRHREWADLMRYVDEVALVLPGVGGRLRTLLSQLPLSTTEPERPLHGNLFGDQILWDGKRVGIVDWDRMILGDPYFDLGRLLAHAIYLALVRGSAPAGAAVCEGLMEGYVERSRRTCDRARLAWHIVVSLILRAKISILRKLPPEWDRQLSLVADECRRIAAGRSEYVELPSLLPAAAH